MLTITEHQALQIEDLRGRVRSDAIYALGMTVNTHARLVMALIDRQDAELCYAALVHRLRRLRDARAAVRRAG